MKNLLLLFLFCCSGLASAQEVISAETQPKTLAFILNLAGLPVTVDYDILNYKITYTTTDAFGMPDTATGLLCVPDNNQFVWPLVIYNHGTIANRNLAPSVPGVLERTLVQVFSGSGFIALAPDYLGLGDSDGLHPYLHADTEASAGRDMIIAVKKWLETQGIRQNDQLFITGYSQGGHASAALHQRLEASATDDLEVTAAAHLSAPFDISVPSPILLSLSNLPPALLAYANSTLISYNYVYELYGDVSNLYKAPYLTAVRSYLTEEIDLDGLGTQLDSMLRANNHLLGEMYSDQFVTDVLDGNAALEQAYNANDVYDWAPQAPTLIYYCNADQTVNPENSILADSVMRANGATGVVLEDGGPLDHGPCAIPAAVRALAFFKAEANVYPVSLGAPASRPELTLVPNPVSAGSTVRLEGLPAVPHAFVVYDVTGRQLLQGETTANGSVRLPASLPKGWNVLRIGLQDGQSVVRRFLVE